MKKIIVVAIGVFCVAGGYFLLKSDAQAQSGCCQPPRTHSSNPRFPQGSVVTVYIDSSSGFTETEQQMIKEGIEDWNGELNSTGVTLT